MPTVERRLIAVEGIVQGVGFRPFVHRLANAHGLRGSVHNSTSGVVIDVEGQRDALEGFLQQLTTSAPPRAAIERVSVERAALGVGTAFRIGDSDAATPRTALVTPDAATCPACVAELFDSADRRYRYPFIACADCGPRFTIAQDVPFDRARTTMAPFALCDACRQEYGNPHDRRCHAQAIACPACGPALSLLGGDAAPLATGEAALALAAAALRAGQIVAVKGLGGYHLATDATDPLAVRRLRARKRRDAKPLAVMVRDVDAARTLCAVSPHEAALLESPERPIVLLARRTPCPLADEVAPGSRQLGLMLPYTPVHHLLLADVGRPLVMTSGNLTDEPIAYRDADALARLRSVADRFLTHDRVIATRCDDSVMRMLWGGPSFVRRSRGFAPQPLRLAEPFPVPVLALGGHLKNTFCFGRDAHAFLSHHVGDLDHPAACEGLREGVAHYARLFALRPELLAHDLHPDYRSTALADQFADVPRVGVQHHHAHVVACAAEHGIMEPVIGVAFDGTGLGTDGAIWGGEFLLVEPHGWHRLAHLDYVALPGGDAAARAPWRMAASHLWAACGADLEHLPIGFVERMPDGEWPLLRQMLERRVACPETSSAGRLFDAVAALLGLRMRAAFEAQAAMELETIAEPSVRSSYPVGFEERGDGWIVDTRPLVRGIVADLAAGRAHADIAGAFHNAVRDLIVEGAERIARRTGVRRVALTGGVFQNALLTERTADALVVRGFEVFLHRRVPCNDGGLALGQAVVASRAASVGG